MKFKVINERTKEVIGSELDIHGARMLKRSLTNKEVDYFYIQEQRKIDKHPRNAEEISSVIKREIKQFLTKLIKKHPNDASLGAEIRKYNNNTK